MLRTVFIKTIIFCQNNNMRNTVPSTPMVIQTREIACHFFINKFLILQKLDDVMIHIYYTPHFILIGDLHFFFPITFYSTPRRPQSSHFKSNFQNVPLQIPQHPPVTPPYHRPVYKNTVRQPTSNIKKKIMRRSSILNLKPN